MATGGRKSSTAKFSRPIGSRIPFLPQYDTGLGLYLDDDYYRFKCTPRAATRLLLNSDVMSTVSFTLRLSQGPLTYAGAN